MGKTTAPIQSADLSGVIERLEKATVPDREIDAEIMFDVFATPVGKHKEDGGPIGYIRLDDQPSWNLGLRFPGKDREWFAATRKQIKGETIIIERDGAHVLMNSLRIPELTGSVDAAIALAERVLPGCELEVTNLYSVARATLYHESGQFYGSSEINSLPIAICIAAVKARALQSKGEA